MSRRTTIKRRELDRRTLLRGAGVAVALPALEAMTPSILREARAAGAPTVPRRALWFYRACGNPIPGDSRIAYDAGAAVLAAKLGGKYNHLYGLKFTDGQWSQSTAGGRPALNGGHTPRMLTILSTSQASWIPGTRRFAVKPTINNVVAQAQKGQAVVVSIGNRAPGAGLEIGGVELFHGYALSKAVLEEGKPDWQPDYQYTNPRELFSLLFTGVGSSSPALSAYKKSILDAALDDVAVLRRNLGGADLRRWDEYASSIREVEKRLAGVAGGPSCSPGAPPAAYPNDINSLDSASYLARLDVVERLLILGMQCDRLTTAHTTYLNMMSSCDWLPGWDNTGGPRNNMHALSHHDGLGNATRAASELKNYVAVVDFFYARFGEFAKRLAATPDFDGRSLLQNCACLMYSEVPTGPSHTGGYIIDMAGEMGGALKTGLGKVSMAGREVADVWATVLAAATSGATRTFGNVVTGGTTVVGNAQTGLLV
jgi:hypothetical protein